jgi:hypothetical protein
LRKFDKKNERTSGESALIQKISNVSGQSSTIEEYDHQHNTDSDSSDVVKVVLNIDQSVAKNELQWDELEKADIIDYKTFPLAMKSCISHYKLDLKQAAAFNIICSTFMLAHLEDPSIKKTLDISELDQAKQVLLAKGGLGRLVINLTGSGSSGKSFVLDATKSFCKQFCKAIGKPFNDIVFIVTATTNTSAAQLKGDTIHSIAGLQRKLYGHHGLS